MIECDMFKIVRFFIISILLGRIKFFIISFIYVMNLNVIKFMFYR